MSRNMLTAKQRVITLLKQLPDDCTLEDIQYHLYVMQKIENGLEDKKAGRTLSQDEVERNVQMELQEKLRELQGTCQWEGDLEDMRRD